MKPLGSEWSVPAVFIYEVSIILDIDNEVVVL